MPHCSSENVWFDYWYSSQSKKKLFFIIFCNYHFLSNPYESPCQTAGTKIQPVISLLLLSETSKSSCGAYVAPGVWKEFECYNLAAIGKTTGDDPFTPSWRLIGGYWQWGRKGPDSSQWYSATNYSIGLFFWRWFNVACRRVPGLRQRHVGLPWYSSLYWSSTENSDNSINAWYLYFYSSNAYTYNNYRSYGFAVRCVVAESD